MKILFLAPQPFFQERGTPIAVRLALRVIAARGLDTVDLLAYKEGQDVSLPGLTTFRIKTPRFLDGVGPGASLKKLLCDVFFLFATIKLVWKNRHAQYDLIHAVEESVFIALCIRFLVGIPYIYDMDSSLALQLTEKWPLLKPISRIFDFFERCAVRHSIAVIPVCDALAVIANNHGSQDTQVLSDVSLLGTDNTSSSSTSTAPPVERIRDEFDMAEDEICIVYIGNLESYQGIDLLVEAFSCVAQEEGRGQVVVIGGREDHVTAYRKKAADAGVASRMHFAGPRPLSSLNDYLTQADILVSPRTLGNNTPMKIYSYLHSGKPLVATDLPTHTQVMDSTVAELAKPEPRAFADALLKLIRQPDYRDALGKRAQELAEKRYTFDVFKRNLCEIYDRVGARIGCISLKAPTNHTLP